MQLSYSDIGVSIVFVKRSGFASAVLVFECLQLQFSGLLRFH